MAPVGFAPKRSGRVREELLADGRAGFLPKKKRKKGERL